MSSKIRDNDPCWCNSGKKFKKCHRDRESQPEINPYDLAIEASSDFRKKYCSHPNAPEACNHIISAHTITKSLVLKTIKDKDGHVYSSTPKFTDIFRDKGRFIPRKVGINDASTFTGFCAKHDNALFEPIEQGSIELNEESIFLLSYRTMAYETYQKKAELNMLMVLRDNIDKGKSFDRQVAVQANISERITFTTMGAHETGISKAKYDAVLKSRDYSDFNYVAVRINEPLPIVTSGGHFPTFGFERNPLFNIYEIYDDPPLVLINILNDKAGAIASIAWFRDDPRLNEFANGFLKMVKERGADFLVQLGIATCNNTFYRSSWWEALDEETQKVFCNAAMSGVVDDVPPWNEAIATPINLGLKGKIVLSSDVN